jgi:pyrroline-5-carboxylate reductase
MSRQQILFIGGGNMTQAIVSGLVTNGHLPKALTVLDRNPEKRAFLSTQYQINVVEQLTPNLFDCDLVVLSIKPQSAKDACLQLRPFLKGKKPLILSVMAGLTISTLHSWLGEIFPVVRAMPNTPALVKAGATGLFASSSVTQEQKLQIESLLSSVGIMAWVEQENQIDIITALSGSGPAYFFLLIEAMQAAAIQLGLPKEIAWQFAVQTAYGASKLALKSQESVSTLRARVTSKGGTTEAAIAVFQQKDFSIIVEAAMVAAKNKAEALSLKMQELKKSEQNNFLQSKL